MVRQASGRWTALLLACLPWVALAGEPAMRTQTASPEFDRLFALAQRELEQDKVDAITDWSFNDQKPFPCVCFETGEKWHYVWTRDLSYAADLSLATLDPERTKTSLRFKLGRVRTQGIPDVRFGSQMVAQDTGSGGSWPISTDRVVWFLAARHLIDDDPAFRRQVRDVLDNTLAADAAYAFDASMGLYRGETSFLDWREQTYPAWTAKDTTWIGESFALSTNVLHYEALQLGARIAERDDTRKRYTQQAAALREAIDRAFWNPARSMYRSYIGPAWASQPVDSYDLLGTSLVILSGVAPDDRARLALSHSPVVAHGSPVIWPQLRDTPIYHNRAMWPFVSAYALRAARKTRDATRIEHEIRSLMRGTALAGSNMENYELTTQAVHVDDGALSGPVVNSPRQLWSVAGYLDMVTRGVFGIEDDGQVAPMLPVALAKELFGTRAAITLHLPSRTVVLRRPARWEGPVLVAASAQTTGDTTTVQLAKGEASTAPLNDTGAAYATQALARPVVGAGAMTLRADSRGQWTWTAPARGRYRLFFNYRNANGPVNTGITAAVQHVSMKCGAAPRALQGVVVMPHNEATTASTSWRFDAAPGPCRITLTRGHNMSDLDHFVHYTGGKGGASGPLNSADIDSVTIVPLPRETED